MGPREFPWTLIPMLRFFVMMVDDYHAPVPAVAANSNYCRCTRCNTVDRLDLIYPQGFDPEKVGAGHLCSVCKYGRWHGRFPKETYNPHRHLVVNPPIQKGGIFVLE